MAQTIAQQRAIAFAPIPFAMISFLASGYVIHYLLFKERRRLERLYHRLVLAMNFALLPLTFTYAWSTFAVPKGTPNYVGASGTIATCTAQGFIHQMFVLTVPTYYGSLGLQAFMSIRNKFKEEKYQWIEYPIHLVAWVFPAAFATLFAVTQNFNPNCSGCAYAKAPHGCGTEPDYVPCERGQDVKMAANMVGFGLICLYFVFPPSAMIAMYCWIKKAGEEAGASSGMQQIREKARKQMMRQVAVQISLYLFSFWSTSVPLMISIAYQLSTGGKLLHGLVVFSNCAVSTQGFIMAMVYFTLERFAAQKLELVPEPKSGRGGDCLTIQDIRASATKKGMSGLEEAEPIEKRISFNIFDGTPDKDSPWAKYFDLDYDDTIDADNPQGAGILPCESEEEEDAKSAPREGAKEEDAKIGNIV